MPRSCYLARALQGRNSTVARPSQAARPLAVLELFLPTVLCVQSGTLLTGLCSKALSLSPILSPTCFWTGQCGRLPPMGHQAVVVPCFGGWVLASAGAWPYSSLCASDVVPPAAVHSQGQVNDENRRPQRRRSGNTCGHPGLGAMSSRPRFACPHG